MAVGGLTVAIWFLWKEKLFKALGMGNGALGIGQGKE